MPWHISKKRQAEIKAGRVPLSVLPDLAYVGTCTRCDEVYVSVLRRFPLDYICGSCEPDRVVATDLAFRAREARARKNRFRRRQA